MISRLLSAVPRCGGPVAAPVALPKAMQSFRAAIAPSAVSTVRAPVVSAAIPVCFHGSGPRRFMATVPPEMEHKSPPPFQTPMDHSTGAASSSSLSSSSPSSSSSDPTGSAHTSSETPPRKPSRFKLRYVFGALAGLLLYLDQQRKAKAELVDELRNSVISAHTREVKDFIRVCQFSSADLEGIRGELYRRHGPLSGGGRIATTMNTKPTSSAFSWITSALTGGSTGDETQSAADEPAEAKGPVLDPIVYITGDEFGAIVSEACGGDMLAWEILSLFRQAPVKRPGNKIDSQELLTALSIFAEDIVPESLAVVDGNKDLVDQLVYDEAAKFNLAWKAHDRDGDGKLNYEELKTMLARLVRTGHISADHLVERVQRFPPKFKVKDIDRVADMYFADVIIDKQRGVDPEVLPDNKESRVMGILLNLSHWLGRLPEPTRVEPTWRTDPSVQINLAEFKTASESLTRARVWVPWYLMDERQGGIKRRTERWKEARNRAIAGKCATLSQFEDVQRHTDAV